MEIEFLNESDGGSRLVKVYGAAVNGIQAIKVTIEAQMSNGTRFLLVGLPDTAVKESHQRIQAAMAESGMQYKLKRYIINMAPADLKKEGAAYDLPLAIALLTLSEDLPCEKLRSTMIMGELALDGQIRPIHGVLPMTLTALKEGFDTIIVPKSNAREAAVVEGISVLGADTLINVVEYLKGNETALQKYSYSEEEDAVDTLLDRVDFAEVKGQESVKRAMEVAAAGMHNIIMIGPPGSGKSMMAKRVPTILPPLSKEEALETTMIHSVAGTLPVDTALIRHRPYRSPHHSTSHVALVGGGSYPKPGEISLAHNGVLFLDELPEFARNVLEVLRQPLEDRMITISRARQTVEFPASFMLVASMNPCPCGYYNDPDHTRCQCPSHIIQNYLNRVSGPLLDRIDIQVEIAPVPFESLSDKAPGESSAAIRERVMKAREIQRQRFKDLPGIHSNSQMTPKLMQEYVHVGAEGLKRIRLAMDRFKLSARAYDRILKVSRTIADLAGSEEILTSHISEAVNYRKLDRSTWGERSL
ncbi:YifB family Mg chelatase-like AAA ATPase [Porphyromonadaceae bacterium W3.11]|nr:YifB family Mg chelatase-like AAA ATPase [Porphyromonadaceae bacterium W3.11]